MINMSLRSARKCLTWGVWLLVHSADALTHSTENCLSVQTMSSHLHLKKAIKRRDHIDLQCADITEIQQCYRWPFKVQVSRWMHLKALLLWNKKHCGGKAASGSMQIIPPCNYCSVISTWHTLPQYSQTKKNQSHNFLNSFLYSI